MQGDEDFAHSLSSYRKRARLSQAELAKRLGISRNWVSMLEGGRRHPSDQLKKSLQMLASSPLLETGQSNRTAEHAAEFEYGGSRSLLRQARLAANLTTQELARKLRRS